MNAQKAIEANLDTAALIATGYLEDLTEEDLLHRPDPKANHIKWQLGHLIVSDYRMIDGCCEGALPPLPEGFAEKYTRETSTEDDPAQFHTKAEYLALYQSQTAAIKDALASLSEEQLDEAAPEEIRSYAPTVGAAFVMVGGHWLMHAGQWAVIRRQLGRDPLF